jgi:hypothetical protein
MSLQNRLDGSMCFKSYIRQTRASEYTFESALAELTDNSIEAGATKIKIYFEMNEEGNLYTRKVICATEKIVVMVVMEKV